MDDGLRNVIEDYLKLKGDGQLNFSKYQELAGTSLNGTPGQKLRKAEIWELDFKYGGTFTVEVNWRKK